MSTLDSLHPQSSPVALKHGTQAQVGKVKLLSPRGGADVVRFCGFLDVFLSTELTKYLPIIAASGAASPATSEAQANMAAANAAMEATCWFAEDVDRQAAMVGLLRNCTDLSDLQIESLDPEDVVALGAKIVELNNSFFLLRLTKSRVMIQDRLMSQASKAEIKPQTGSPLSKISKARGTPGATSKR